MPNLYKALLDERVALVGESKALVAQAERESRGLTDAERERDDQIAARLDVIAGDLKREERRREWERTVEAQPSLAEVLPNPSPERPVAPKPLFRSMGEQLVAIKDAYVSNHRNVDGRLLEVNRIGAAIQGMNTQVMSEGGYLLETQAMEGLWARAYEIGQIMSRVFRIPIAANVSSIKINGLAESSRATGSRWGGVRSYWLAEGDSLTKSQTKFNQFEFSPKKMAALYYATDEELRSAPTLEAIVNSVIPMEMAWMVEDAILRGDGVGKPAGILGSPALITVSAESGQQAATVTTKNIMTIWSRLYAPCRANAVWLINQDVEPALDEMVMTAGTAGWPMYMPAGGISQASLATLKARPVIVNEHSSTLGTVGDIVAADLSQYGFCDRGAIESAMSIHVEFLTDQSVFRFIAAYDGQSMWKSALTPANGSNTLSPFVALATRA